MLFSWRENLFIVLKRLFKNVCLLLNLGRSTIRTVGSNNYRHSLSLSLIENHSFTSLRAVNAEKESGLFSSISPWGLWTFRALFQALRSQSNPFNSLTAPCGLGDLPQGSRRESVWGVTEGTSQYPSAEALAFQPRPVSGQVPAFFRYIPISLVGASIVGSTAGFPCFPHQVRVGQVTPRVQHGRHGWLTTEGFRFHAPLLRVSPS